MCIFTGEARVLGEEDIMIMIITMKMNIYIYIYIYILRVI